MVRTWLFGEAEYESTETRQQNFDRLFNVGENCGYMINSKNFRNGMTAVTMEGSDLESIYMLFKGDELIKIKKKQMTDRKGPDSLELVSEEELVINR